MNNTENFPFRLKECVWEITLACCFSCKYCGSKGGKARENELTTEECIDVVKQLSQLGCKRVSLIGGEIFMRSDWDVILNELTKHNIIVCIITNGYLFSESIINTLKNSNIESVAVSLDGPEAVHDMFRQKGSFQRANNAIDILTKNGIYVSVISTLNSYNVSFLEEFYQYLKTKPISAWQLQACSPMGNAANYGVPYDFSFQEVIGFVEKHLFDSDFIFGVADNIGYFTESEGSIRGNTSGYAFFKGCSAGLSSIGIDSIGNVRGCESMYDDYFIEGNIREKSLAEIWYDPDSFAYNRKFNPSMLTGICSKCSYGKKCAAGCRSYNYFTAGKLYESKNCALKHSKK